ncbi:MAG: anthranilate synthase component I [Lachnospiraceae bacterium]|nr:anthranilate synthase component I [Lachnospiraceae bacterium]
MYTPSVEEAARYAGEYDRIPVKREILSDIKTPIQVLKILKNHSDHVYMLESVKGQENRGRYTFLGFNPVECITCLNGDLKVTDDKGNVVFCEHTDHPSAYLRKRLAELKSVRLPGFPSFTGGLVGYFSYDYIKYSEPSLVLDAKDNEHFKDMDLMLFDKVIAFDNVRQKIVIIANVRTDDLDESYREAVNAIDNIAELIEHGDEAFVEKGRLTSGYRPLFDEESFCSMVKKGKEYIYEGDIFQVVLSNRLEADFDGSLLNTYRVLRTLNPSPYMFYFSGDDMEACGASPETLVKLEDGVLHTFPLAGTRRRGKDEEEDKALEKELLSDEKECAEHNMLVDLGRNDIGRISRFGSVCVDDYMSVERFSHVMHIGSSVKGIIKEGKDALDAIDAILPAGTLSGAPKLRACEIINELEDNKRGLYGGAIGYIDFTGNLDTCIAIRLVFKKNGRVFVRSGAGIVADSEPEKEYQECINKAKAVMTAIEMAERIED